MTVVGVLRWGGWEGVVVVGKEGEITMLVVVMEMVVLVV